MRDEILDFTREFHTWIGAFMDGVSASDVRLLIYLEFERRWTHYELRCTLLLRARLWSFSYSLIYTFVASILTYTI